ncbi:MAG TPA: tetratricopeptide repeat protein [Ktedonobacterales bacterium]|nr:tetratricopeptide repeat protein [Ktedonobacterales bacterium]
MTANNDLTPGIWLYVSNLERSVAFYRDTLGLRQVESSAEMPGFALGQMRLWLRQRPAAAAKRALPEWGALMLPAPEGIEPRIRELAARGVSFSASLKETPQGRVAQFHDPDGHPLCFWEVPAEQLAASAAQSAEQAKPALLLSAEEARRLREIDELLTKAEQAKTAGNYADAATFYRIALEARPGQAGAWGSLGFVLNELGRYTESLAATELALALDPSMPEAWNNQGNALDSLKRHEEALAAYDRALELAPATAEFWVNKGAALTNLRRSDEALEAFDRALALDSKQPGALANRAWALALLGRYDEALASVERALKLGLRVAGVLDTKGYALAGLGRYQESLECYRQALAQAPNDPDILAHEAAARQTMEQQG